MKVSELIKTLEVFKKENGDAELTVMQNSEYSICLAEKEVKTFLPISMQTLLVVKNTPFIVKNKE